MTRPMIVTVNGLAFTVDLEARLGPAQWERLYLEEGFRRPDTGQVIEPSKIYNVSVTPAEAVLKPFPAEGALAWLEAQIEETCAAGRL